ncbi:blast:Slender lobes-like protein [Drosophila guanche]|uniref:Blast:Slender lobes-like protein n=1 Tax=Drosophila guanche TaxID=7266 RepID=A0A3B0KTF6_DROGU|nr:blast:Slender lobes-like protein [Drosophila guanche]
MKTTTTRKQKQKSQLVSPVKSSAEENHRKSPVVKRINTSAGSVTLDDAPEPCIELIRTRSGIMHTQAKVFPRGVQLAGAQSLFRNASQPPALPRSQSSESR